MQRYNLLRYIILGMICTGCLSYSDEMLEVRSSFLTQNYSDALEKLEESTLRYDKSSILLYLLEKAMIYDRMEDRKKSRALLISADKYIDKLYTTSLSKSAATFVVNDSISDYEGEDFEKVSIHTMLALSFISENNLSAAGVQARKINEILRKISNKYSNRDGIYSEDAFARYLSGSIYEALGQDDSAIIDYVNSLSLYRSDPYQQFVNNGVPPSLIRSLYLLALKKHRGQIRSKLEKLYPNLTASLRRKFKQYRSKAQLLVFHEYGKIATKKEKDFIYAVGDDIIRYSFPYYSREHSLLPRKTGVYVGKKMIRAENLSNLTSIAYHNLETRRTKIFLKNITRLIAKNALADEAHKVNPIFGLIIQIFNLATETADTRSWTLLPDGFYATKVWLKPGTHRIKILTDGRITNFKTITLKPGELKMIRDF